MTLTRRHLLDVVRIVVALLVLAAVSWALWKNWDAVAGNLRRIDGPTLALSFACALASPPLTVLGWRALLADLGTRLTMPASASIFLVGQLGKYLPGSVWSVVVQTDMGARLGVPRKRMGVVGLLTIALAALSGAIVGIPAVPLLLARSEEHVSPWWLLLAVPFVALALWPRAINWGIGRGLRMLRREPLEHALGWRALTLSVLAFVAAWVMVGLSAWVLARELAPGADHLPLFIASVCGFSLASSAGMFSIFVPAGVGVRDGVLAFLLVALMPLPAATAIVVIVRFWTIITDVVCALSGWLWGRTHHLLGGAHERPS